MDRNDQARAVSHALKLAALQIRRQAAVAGTGVAAMQRLPGKVICLIGMSVDQAQQPLVKYVVERRAAAQESPLLRRNTEAEQQRRGARYQPRQWRMKQAIQTIQRRNALGRVWFAVQQRRKVNPGEFRQQMGKANETAEHAVAIKPVCEIDMPRTPDDVALVPVSARIRIKYRSQPLAIEFDIRWRSGLTEELPELAISREGPDTGKLE